MKTNILCFLVALFAGLTSAAQEAPDSLGSEIVRLTKNQGDCIGAWLITDTVMGPVLSPQGFGNKIDVQGNELGDLYWFEREHNTVWYKIKVPYKTTLEFDIIPLNENDDFDFLLFEYTGPAFCDKMKKKEVLPVRTNISRNNTHIGGRTGLSKEATEEFVPSGPGSPYSAALEVEKGAVYYLVIDNPFRANKGHTVHIHYGPRPKRRQRTQGDGQVTKTTVETAPMTINVVDEATGEPIYARLHITGGRNNIDIASSKSYTFDAEMYRTYSIECDKSGYMFGTIKETALRKDSVQVLVKMRKIETGAKVTLPNIKFVANKADFLPTSNSSLERLLKFMQDNPDVTIEIGGHVNGTKGRNSKKYKALSAQRAKAVYTWLWENGIDRSRMKFKGYGNAHMVYPDPVNEKQAENNRRVEIRIL